MYLPEIESVMHGYVWCMPGLDQQKHGPTKKHEFLIVSDTVMMVTIVLYTEKLGILYQLCIYLCNWNLSMYPVGVLEGYHLAYVQIIGIIQAHLNYNHFNSIHFLWHWIGIDIHWIYSASISSGICCYISVTVMFHEYGYREWYCNVFDDVHLMNRLLLSRLLVYFIVPYLCNNILINIYVDDWHFAIRWQFDIFRTIMQVTYLSSSG